MISQELLEVLACPKCHTKVELKEPDHLRCPQCKVLYPIVEGIPVMLIEEAKPEYKICTSVAGLAGVSPAMTLCSRPKAPSGETNS